MKRWQDWVIALGIMGLLTAVFFIIFPTNNDTNKTITLPDDYYQLPVDFSAEVICIEPKSQELLIGFVDFYEYPPQDSKNTILVTLNTGLKGSDLKKPNKSDEDEQKLVQLISSLKPYALFYLHYSKDGKISMDVYTRRVSSWTDAFKFWVSQFEKEWQLLETWNYENDEQAKNVGKLSLRKVYGMDCRIQ